MTTMSFRLGSGADGLTASVPLHTHPLHPFALLSLILYATCVAHPIDELSQATKPSSAKLSVAPNTGLHARNSPPPTSVNPTQTTPNITVPKSYSPLPLGVVERGNVNPAPRVSNPQPLPTSNSHGDTFARTDQAISVGSYSISLPRPMNKLKDQCQQT